MIESSVLHSYHLFDGIEKEQIDNVLSLMKEENYNAGAEIIAEGTHNYKIYFILEGRAAVVKNGIIIQEIEEGAFFGEMEVLDVNPAAAAVSALVDTKIIYLSIDALGEIYDKDLKTYCFIIMNLAKDLSRKLRRLDVILTSESPPTDWS